MIVPPAAYDPTFIAIHVYIMIASATIIIHTTDTFIPNLSDNRDVNLHTAITMIHVVMSEAAANADALSPNSILIIVTTNSAETITAAYASSLPIKVFLLVFPIERAMLTSPSI